MGLGMGQRSHHPWLEALLTLQETPGVQSQMTSQIIKHPNWKGPQGSSSPGPGPAQDTPTIPAHP